MTRSIFVPIGAAAAIYGRDLNSGVLMGPGFFPIVVGILMAVSGAIIVAGSFSEVFAPGGTADEPTAPPLPLTGRRIVAIAAIPLAIVAYILLVRTAGSLLMNALLVAAVAIAWGQRWLSATVLGVVTSIGIFLFFRAGLKIPLPGGVIEALVW